HATRHPVRQRARAAAGDVLPPPVGARPGSTARADGAPPPLPSLRRPRAGGHETLAAADGIPLRHRAGRAGVAGAAGRSAGNSDPDFGGDRVTIEVVVSRVPGDGWQRAVDAACEARLAHAPQWQRVIANAYAHTPLYLEAEAADGSRGVLPAFVVRRPLFGTVVTSMPFLDSGGPCSTSAAVDASLVDHLIAEARRLGARLVELRCPQRLAIDAEPLSSKVNMTLTLDDPAALWRRFGKGVRNQIRKAERAGLTVE